MRDPRRNSGRVHEGGAGGKGGAVGTGGEGGALAMSVAASRPSGAVLTACARGGFGIDG